MYITEIFLFCNDCIFIHMLLFTPPFFSDRSTIISEKQINLIFFYPFGQTPLQALQILQHVYEDNAMSHTRVFERHKRFKEGQEGVKYNFSSRRPSPCWAKAYVEHIRLVVNSDRCLEHHHRWFWQVRKVTGLDVLSIQHWLGGP